MSQTASENLEIIIRPNKSWFYIDWQGILHYRDLLFFLVRRDFVAHYKQTILGPLWFILQPLLMTLVFTVIFGNIAKIPTDGVPPMLFYLCGLLGWRYFSDCFNATASTFISNFNLFEKVYFPRLIIPLASVVSALFTYFIQFVTFLAFFAYFKFFTEAGISIKPNLSILLIPFVTLHAAALSLGIGLWMAALTAKYRDLRFLLQFLTQLWMYATPIIYPMSLVPEKWKGIIALNPMVPVIEFYRYAFFGVGDVNPQYIAVSLVVTVVSLFSGIFIFNKVGQTFIDTI